MSQCYRTSVLLPLPLPLLISNSLSNPFPGIRRLFSVSSTSAHRTFSSLRPSASRRSTYYLQYKTQTTLNFPFCKVFQRRFVPYIMADPSPKRRKVNGEMVASISKKQEKLKQWFIGSIDQGTTSSRFLIFDGTGTPVASHQIEFKQMYPQSG